MKLKVTMKLSPWGKGSYYNEIEGNGCCERIDTAFEEGIIGYGSVEDDYDNHKSVNIFGYDQTEKQTWVVRPIDFCPFCGEKIEITHIPLEEEETTATVR